MKRPLIFISIWTFFSCHEKSDSSAQTERLTSTQKNSPDTVFIEKTSRYFVYINNNKNSRFYEVLSDFSYNNPEQIGSTIKYFKKNKIQISHNNMNELFSEWLPVIKYKDKYYLYISPTYPRSGKYKITDSLIYRYDMVGPQPGVIESIEQISKKKFLIKTSKKIIEEVITIHIIDDKTKIAVWETNNVAKKELQYKLCIPKEYMKSLDIIVNSCIVGSFDVFKPDTINFQKLINGN